MRLIMPDQPLLSVDDLRSLHSNLERMWQVLIAVATGGEHIGDLEENYSQLRKQIDICIETINAAGANFKVDLFFTLREWQTYWRKNLKNYASRRAFIVDRFSLPVDILERVIREADSAAPMTPPVTVLLNQHLVGKKLQIDFTDLHPKIVKRCKVHLDNGQYDDAVLVAMKLVETELRETSRLTADDVGVHLASKALGKDGVLVLPRAKTIAEQEAVHQLFRGALGFFKNPLSHRFLDETDPHYTFFTLGFASILLTLIEQFERQPRSDAL
jgi:uncharacterized protein (TIGR02391 family)